MILFLYIQLLSQRVITLTPALNEYLYFLKVEQQLVATVRHARAPEHIPTIGDAFSINHEQLIRLKPDLILLQKEQKSALEPLKRFNIKQISLKINRLLEILPALNLIKKKLKLLDHRTINPKGLLLSVASLGTQKNAVVIIDHPPSGGSFYTVGSGNFINDYLPLLGFHNLITRKGYPEINLEHLIRLNPEAILLLSPTLSPDMFKKYSYLKAVKQKQIYHLNNRIFTLPVPALWPALLKLRKEGLK